MIGIFGPPSFDRRVTYPLLRVAEWCTLFTQCGFKNVWHTPDEAPGVFLLVAPRGLAMYNGQFLL